MYSFTLSEAASLLDLPMISTTQLISQVVADSRLVRQGALFFALRGTRVDGHDFLQEVAERGAVGAVVDEQYVGSDFGLVLLRVPHVLLALQQMGKRRLQRKRVRVVAVTGSVGKTTTKEFIADLLSERYRVTRSPGNANSQVGVPLSILNMPENQEVIVLEMGMSAKGQIEKLVEIAPPEVAVVTKIGLSHAEYFSDIEAIAAAKAEIFSHPDTRIGVIGRSSSHYAVLHTTGSCEKLIGPSLEEIDVRFTLPFQASHLCENFALAASVAHIFGLTWEEIISRSSSLKPHRNRFEQFKNKGVLFINDSYNASPESMSAALENMPAPSGDGRRVAVLGEMKELGRFSEESHRKIGRLALSKVDHLFCYGAACRPMIEVFTEVGRSVEFLQDFEGLRRRLFSFLQEGDVVLVKGSNSNGLWKLFDESLLG